MELQLKKRGGWGQTGFCGSGVGRGEWGQGKLASGAAFPAWEAVSGPSALGVLLGTAAPARGGCQERESVVSMRGP